MHFNVNHYAIGLGWSLSFPIIPKTIQRIHRNPPKTTDLAHEAAIEADTSSFMAKNHFALGGKCGHFHLPQSLNKSYKI